MRVIAKSTLVEYYTKNPQAKVALDEWYIKTKQARWSCFADVKNTFNSVDNVGNQHYVFNIKGNDFRLVVVLDYGTDKGRKSLPRGIAAHRRAASVGP